VAAAYRPELIDSGSAVTAPSTPCGSGLQALFRPQPSALRAIVPLRDG